MMPQRRVAVIVSGIAALVLLAVITVLLLVMRRSGLLYSANKFQGNGTIIDKGIASGFPRYQVEFPVISLAKTGTYEYTCSRLPPVEMLFAFSIVNQPETREELMAEIGDVTVEWTCNDSEGKKIFEGRGPLKEWDWTWRGGQDHSFFWTDEMIEIKVKSDLVYTLAITVENPAKKDSIKLKPVMQGGGFEIDIGHLRPH